MVASPNDSGEGGDRGTALRTLALYGVVVGLASVVGAVAARVADLEPAGQRIVVAAFALGALSAVAIVRRDLGRDNPGTVLLTVSGSVAVVLAVASSVGVIEDEPGPGCLNTDGPLEATVSAPAAVLYSRATPASSPRGLLTRGCKLQALGYCLGASHRDALQPGVYDTRWLVLSDGQGLIAAGDTAGTIPAQGDRVDCQGAQRRPDAVRFEAAVYDRDQRRVSLLATAPRAAFIGFAVRLANGNWKRLGWDRAPENDLPQIADAPDARVGATVAAVACIAFQQPTAARDFAKLVPGRARPADLPFVTQPVRRDSGRAACNAGIPDPSD